MLAFFLCQVDIASRPAKPSRNLCHLGFEQDQKKGICDFPTFTNFHIQFVEHLRGRPSILWGTFLGSRAPNAPNAIKKITFEEQKRSSGLKKNVLCFTAGIAFGHSLEEALHNSHCYSCGPNDNTFCVAWLHMPMITLTR